MFLANALAFAGKVFVTDLAAGLPIVGSIGATPTPNSEPQVNNSEATYAQREEGFR